MSSLCQWFCTCRCIGKRNKDFLNANTKAPFCRNKNMATSGGGGGGGHITNQPSKGPETILTRPTYTCDICGQEGLNEDDMKTHVLIEHLEGAISCPFCDLEGTTAEEMTLHVNTQHLDFSVLPSDENEEEKKEEGNGLKPEIETEKNKQTQISGGGVETEESGNLSNSKQKLNQINTEKQNKNVTEKEVAKTGSNKESVRSYMPLQEVRNSSEVSMDTGSSYHSNQSSATCSPESEISVGNRESSSGNDHSSSYEASSSCTSTPDDVDPLKFGADINPREITIRVIHDSPKKQPLPPPGDDADFKMDTSSSSGFDGDPEQSRKRAKLYLHVPQPHSPRRQPAQAAGSGASASADAGAASRTSYLLDSHASTTQLHHFVHLGAPR